MKLEQEYLVFQILKDIHLICSTKNFRKSKKVKQNLKGNTAIYISQAMNIGIVLNYPPLIKERDITSYQGIS